MRVDVGELCAPLSDSELKDWGTENAGFNYS